MGRIGFLWWWMVVLGAVASAPERPHVLLIGIDGLRPDALAKARTPRLDALIADGAFSDRAQTGDITYSGPGWSSMLTGVWREKHGVHSNRFTRPRFDLYPTFLTRLKASRPDAYTVGIVSWVPIRTRILPDLDYSIAYSMRDDIVAEDAVRVLREEDPDALFVYFGDVDYAGHDFGFDPASPRYIASIETTDDYVGAVLDALTARPRFDEENWLILVSTDHGGLGRSHGQNIPPHRTIFVIVSGRAAERGTIEPPPEIVDVAVTALVHLGVPIDPAWGLDGKAVGLRPTPLPTSVEAEGNAAILWGGLKRGAFHVRGER